MPTNQVRRNGSYAPLSAHYYKDDKVAMAGEKAEILYVRGLAFCADVLSDGLITDIQLLRFVGNGLSNPVARAQKLVQVGLWCRDDESGGYRVSSWGKWNRSKAEIDERLRKDADRKSGQ